MIIVSGLIFIISMPAGLIPWHARSPLRSGRSGRPQHRRNVFDIVGNLYLGDPTAYAMVQITPNLKMHTRIKDERLIWPDTYLISKDGYMDVTTSQINKQPDYNDTNGF